MNPELKIIFAARGVRGFFDGMIGLTLPVYLIGLGFTPSDVGLLVTAMLLGAAFATLAIGSAAHYWSGRTLLTIAASAMVATGLSFISIETFWPLLLVAFIGTINPSAGDSSLFLPVEHAQIAHAVTARQRTSSFARYSFFGAVGASLGALGAALPETAIRLFEIDHSTAIKLPFVFYAMAGIACMLLYSRLPRTDVNSELVPPQRRLGGASRRKILILTALFSLDAFGGGFVVNSILALWLFQRFGLDLVTAGTIFFWVNAMTAVSLFGAPRLARRIGLANTMVFPHFLASIALVVLPFMPTLEASVLLLVARSLLSPLDVPARSSYVMAMVTPAERTAAASLAAAPRSLMLALSPALAGVLLSVSSFGWSLLVAGTLKILYDILLLIVFQKFGPVDELGERREIVS